jgi:hypothetical protein
VAPMSMEPDGTGPREPDGGPVPKDEPAPPAPSPTPPAPGSPLSAQSSEDTDVGWGDYAEQDDDWLLRDRPPHWDR